MNPEGFDIDETMHGTLVIRPRAEVALPADPDMEVVLGLMREEVEKVVAAEAEGKRRKPFDWWAWWGSVREAMRVGDVETLESQLQLGLKKGLT